VTNSHGRYANVDISYLLQRLERHPELVILTTNMKSAIARAFLHTRQIPHQRTSYGRHPD
jgi:hypothetical protein